VWGCVEPLGRLVGGGKVERQELAVGASMADGSIWACVWDSGRLLKQWRQVRCEAITATGHPGLQCCGTATGRWLACAQRDLRRTAGQHRCRVRGRNGRLASLGNGVKGTSGSGLEVVATGPAQTPR
jgi:hypothetical protein